MNNEIIEEYVDWIDTDTMVRFQFTAPQTEYEAFKASDNVGKFWKNASEEKIRAEFSDELDEEDIEAWRRKTHLYIEYKGKTVVHTQFKHIQRASYADLVGTLDGKDYISPSKRAKVVIPNKDNLKDIDARMNFIAFINDPSSDGERYGDKGATRTIVVIPDISGMYGIPAALTPYDDVLANLHERQNRILAKYRDKIANPAQEAIEDVLVGYSIENLADLAGISKTTLMRAKKGENISVDTLLKLAKATGTLLKISFD